jgi:hypothetical protein
MKKILSIIFFMVLLAFLMTFFCEQNVEFVLLNTYSNNKIDFKGDVKLINDPTILEELYESSNSHYNVDTDISTVILSKKKINKIRRIPKYKLFPVFTHFHEHLQKMMSHGRPYMALQMIDTKTKVFTMLKLWRYQNEI